MNELLHCDLYRWLTLQDCLNLLDAGITLACDADTQAAYFND